MSERPAHAPALDRSGDETDPVLMLGRAVRQLRMYSESHAQARQAVELCRKALIGAPGSEDLVVRVPRLQLGEDETGPDPAFLAQLRHARVSELSVRRYASTRDLIRFAGALLASGPGGVPLTDRLADAGITTIAVRLVPRPALLGVATPDELHLDLLAHERKRRAALFKGGGKAAHLYPPDKGWVRIDPAIDYPAFSLTELAIAVSEPAEFAGMLERLALEGEPPEDAASAVERRFPDVVRIFGALEPRLAQVKFARLAETVLALDPASRRRLLLETVLPGLLDAEMEGAILRDFPDPALAEALCLLLELESAGPRLIAAALDRLELTLDRRDRIETLIQAELDSRSGTRNAASAALDRFARRLTRIDASPGLQFTEFAAFDLAFDEGASAELETLEGAIRGTDAMQVRLECMLHIVLVEPNPEVVAAILESFTGVLSELVRAGRWAELAVHATRLREAAHELGTRRPEVADATEAALVAFCTPEFARTLLTLHDTGAVEGSESTDVLDAIAGALAPALLALLEEPQTLALTEALTALMTTRGHLYAPAFVARLETGSPSVAAPMIVKLLGYAGAGYEESIAVHLEAPDEPLVREAIRALARIGSPAAVRFLVARLGGGPDELRTVALEALIRVPAAIARVHAREVLALRDMARRHPGTMRAFLDRTVRPGDRELADVLPSLARLRFRFWSPPVARLGRRARALMAP